MNLRTFEQHVHQHKDRVFGLACYLLHDRQEAEDVTQEVLLRLWRHRDRVDEERLLPWLLRVTRNASIDAMRRRKAYRAVHAADPDAMDRAPGHQPSPDAGVQSAVFQERLQRALDQIREPYRSIVILREVQDLKYEEICGAMDLPLNTVKVYLHRGRKMLREQLREVMPREIA